jgi:hypothetical protein
LGLPDEPPVNADENGTAYIDELIFIYNKLIQALEVVKEKVTAITAQRRVINP